MLVLEPVSILVLVDVGLRHEKASRVWREYIVSILVLVDVGLRLGYRWYADDDSGNGFNPCFSGCWSSTQGVRVFHTPLSVSILVLVDVGLRHYPHECGSMNETFQSLF